jgi:hypothetical protein
MRIIKTKLGKLYSFERTWRALNWVQLWKEYRWLERRVPCGKFGAHRLKIYFIFSHFPSCQTPNTTTPTVPAKPILGTHVGLMWMDRMECN